MPSAAASARECSVARTLEIVGARWALLALREIFLGNRRFDEIARRTGAPRDTLAARLRVLTSTGILERRMYSRHPARHEYYLTPAGLELFPVILALMRWGDQHLAGESGPPLVLEHSCGQPLGALMVCESCGEPVHAERTWPAGRAAKHVPVGAGQRASLTGRGT